MLPAISMLAAIGVVQFALLITPPPAVQRSRQLTMQEALPDTEEGWMTVLNPNQFAVLRQAVTEPPGYSETVKGELEYELKKSYGTKYVRQ